VSPSHACEPQRDDPPSAYLHSKRPQGRSASHVCAFSVCAYGFCMLGLAFGVYRRKQWAWRLVLVFFGATWLTSILQTFTSAQFPDGAAVRPIFCVLSLVVALYWSWWWYAQRIHFLSDADAPLQKQPW
jgi:uncharacterized membrane protein YfcA